MAGLSHCSERIFIFLFKDKYWNILFLSISQNRKCSNICTQAELYGHAETQFDLQTDKRQIVHTHSKGGGVSMIGPPLLMACLLFILYLNISVTLCTMGRRISCHLWKTICPWILSQIVQLFGQGLNCTATPVASHQLTVWPFNKRLPFTIIIAVKELCTRIC